MLSRESIAKAVYQAIDEVNLELPSKDRLAKSPETPLVGGARAIDSVQIANLIVLSEEKIEEQCGVAVRLMDADLLGGQMEPLRTVGSFISFIESQCQT